MPQPDRSSSLLGVVDTLIAAGMQVNLERRGAGWRLRYRQSDMNGTKQRKSLALPRDNTLLAEVRERLVDARLQRRKGLRTRPRRNLAGGHGRALRELKQQVFAASGRGRWLRQRIGRMFDLAIVLGPEVLDDCLGHTPWFSLGKPTGRPCGTGYEHGVR